MILTSAYAGIGARATPTEILEVIEGMARNLALRGLTLRSGGADGADTAFENGCDVVNGSKEIFLPWKDFNENRSVHWQIPMHAYDLAERFHPAGAKLKSWHQVKNLMARNVQQVLGKDLDSYSSFVLCWTPDGAESKTTKATGGTGQAIRVANAYNIPVFNLKNENALLRLQEYLDTLSF